MTTIWYNGDYIDSASRFICHRDCGFTTGIGVFDSMLAENGTPIHITDHFDRVMHDARTVIGIAPDMDKTQFAEIIGRLLTENNLTAGYARIRTTITGGIVSRPLAVAEQPGILIDAAGSSYDNSPVSCAIIADYPRVAGNPLYNCKRLDYSESYAARRLAEKMGAAEAILTNTNGNIACGATSNLFIEENGILMTPPLSEGVLAGVTRKHLIAQGAREEPITKERLITADKAFLTNSFIGLRPVTLLR